MKKLSVTIQIVILILTMGIMGIGVGLFGIYKIAESNQKLNAVLEDAFKPFQDLKNTSYIFESTILLNLEKIANHELSWKNGNEKINIELDKAKESLANFNPDNNYTEEFKYFQLVQEHFQQFEINYNLLKNKIKGNNNFTSNDFTDLYDLIQILHTDFNILMDMQINKASLIQKENKADFIQSILYYAIILVIGVGVSMTISLFILFGIKGYIGSINRLIQKIASGDLSTNIVRRGAKDFGEIHENLRQLSNKFTEILELSQNAANNISVTSEEMSSNAQTISSGANQQAASVEEIAASMEEISSRVQENTDNSITTQKISSKVADGLEMNSPHMGRFFKSKSSDISRGNTGTTER